MRAETSEADDAADGSAGLIEVILARMAQRQISLRSISALTGIKRGRAHNILHRDAAKRHPMRLDEKSAILRCLDIGLLEASLAADVLSKPEASLSAAGTVATMLSELLDGLPGDIVRLVETIEGVDFTDVRPEHGRRLRALILKFVEREYSDVGVRRLKRLTDNEML
ncbi:hypothetical protein [Sphingomonas sp. GC_Shp_6]|nr:hypothetical protein [Sphingomonas sp. GC_Shp_6]